MNTRELSVEEKQFFLNLRKEKQRHSISKTLDTEQVLDSEKKKPLVYWAWWTGRVGPEKQQRLITEALWKLWRQHSKTVSEQQPPQSSNIHTGQRIEKQSRKFYDDQKEQVEKFRLSKSFTKCLVRPTEHVHHLLKRRLKEEIPLNKAAVNVWKGISKEETNNNQQWHKY